MDKPIKLAGFSAATPLARQLIASNPVGMISMEQVPMLAVFTLESTTFDFVGSRQVPHLRLQGRLDRLIPENPQTMPYLIGEIGLSEEESIRVVGDYPFTTEQLGVLVHKGLYLEGFSPSSDWVGLPFEVDTRIDLRILPPNQDDTPPLAIADLSPMRFFDMRLETSRYDLAEHFPDYRRSLIEAGKITGNEALGVDQGLAQGQADLSDFAFGGPVRDKLDQVSVTGPGNKDLIKRLSTLMDVELAAPTALRGLREDLRGDQIRAERARANLVSPGLSDLYGESVANPAPATPPQDDDELSKIAEQLDNIDVDDMDFGDLDLSGFSFGEDESAPGAIEPAVIDDNEEESLPTLTLSPPTEDPIVASVIAESENEGFSFGDSEEDDQVVRSRRARQAREASARRARQRQQLGTERHGLPEGNTAPTTDHEGPQLGG
ncbi:hypothetical protein [Rhodococcus sp. NCIMB 12038]|uniref:hypothetical protein n=1 Tax=Rhodococcus sp. NCIMB 12038 TaxID=933800 RepID=UPI000B3C33E4|nr:hypothetical protein [Rhodococcus sp. NCIMB 12038]OUS97227.1 hypothetical protein CA951_02460 [Rhodococcus sp. NCIMB 12038]